MIQDIEYILSTYDISDAKREKIRSRCRNLARPDNTFAQDYELVSELVETYRKPAEEFFSLKLDMQSGNKRHDMHEIISSDDASDSFSDDRCSEEQSEDRLSLSECLEILADTLEREDIALIRKLAEQEDIKIDLTKENLDPAKVHDRLIQIIRQFEYKGVLVIPQRPISFIDLRSPLIQVRYRQRNYSKNPLKFYNQHIDRYKGLSRSELRDVDQGLYQALLRYKQMDKAIPYKRTNGLGKENRERVKKAWDSVGPCVTDIAKELGVHTSVVSRHLKALDLKANSRGGKKLSQEQLKQIDSAYFRYDGRPSVAAKNIGVTWKTIRKYWRRAGYIY